MSQPTVAERPQMKQRKSEGFEVLISEKDMLRMQKENEQNQAELDHYVDMIENVLGKEELKETAGEDSLDTMMQEVKQEQAD